jgi:hypothetical protein
MKIAVIGNYFHDVHRVSFFSTETFLEYDALIIDISTIAQGSSSRGIEFFEKRRSALLEFVAFKKTPIIYLAPETNKLHLHQKVTVERTVSEVLPIPEYEIENEKGKEYIIASKTPFVNFLEKYKTWFGYNNFYKEYTGTSIAVTPYTNKVIAFYTEDCVFLPALVAFDINRNKEFLFELVECLKSVRFDPNANPLPQWSEFYFLPGEYDAKQKIIHLNEQIEKLNLEVEEKKRELEYLTEKKRLFTASGDELEMKVASIFRDLGFEILQAEKNRDDLIVKYGNETAVVEIKGLNNSAGEKNAAQLEKWRATYFEVHGVNPKGILLVNTYKETPLALRNQADFPDQMLRYATGREHCLITTLQLLTLHFEAGNNPESKEFIIKTLFSTVGRYPDNYKWQDYIKVVDC